MKKTLQFFCKGAWLVLVCFFSCIHCTKAQTVVDVGKSLANVSKLATGGTFNPGDTIEVRVTFAVANVAPAQITAVQVFDTVPAKTTYIPGSMRTATNENYTFQGPFTDAFDNTDAAENVGGNINMNLGTGATKSVGGTISNTDQPSFYGGTCILVACFRLKINAADVYGDTIKIGGKVVYKISGVTTTKNWPLYSVVLFQSSAACSNGLAVSAASDSLGTFASGTVQNRVAALGFATTYTKQTIGAGNPADYNYAIVNNSSADGSTNQNVSVPNAHRVFTVWDVSGDHTGAANTAMGNPAVAPGARGGYMVVVNASYKTDTAYRETLSNLCPSTYYEFSAWFRNICAQCGCDKTGLGANSVGFTPAPGNDSAGVRPNLNFEIDGLVYYTTGDIKYSRAIPWKKYGFTFLTKVGQTTASFLIRNNSPGGGGNDWALDDIVVAHCGPTLKMNYNPLVLGCSASPFVVTLRDTIRYFFSNTYVYYKWQKSNVGGTIWSDMVGAGTSGIGVPSMVNGQWQYVTTLPSFLALPADSGTYYRVKVATTLANLNSANCSYDDQSQTMIKVINCGIVLNVNITRFAGQLAGRNAYLTWSASSEQNLRDYEIEKSYDGINFSKIASVNAKNITEAHYNFTDPDMVNGNTYYRLKINDENNLYKYSNIIVVSSSIKFDVRVLPNPFKNTVTASVMIPVNGKININLANDKGQVFKTVPYEGVKGVNNILLDNLGGVSNGVYFLFIEYNNESTERKLIKIN